MWVEPAQPKSGEKNVVGILGLFLALLTMLRWAGSTRILEKNCVEPAQPNCWKKKWVDPAEPNLFKKLDELHRLNSNCCVKWIIKKIIEQIIKIFEEKISDFHRENWNFHKENHKSLRNCPNRCQRVSKPTVKKPNEFQTAVSIGQFLCPGTTLYVASSPGSSR